MSRSSAQAAAFYPTMALAIKNHFAASLDMVSFSHCSHQVALIVVVRLEGCGGGPTPGESAVAAATLERYVHNSSFALPGVLLLRPIFGEARKLGGRVLRSIGLI